MEIFIVEAHENFAPDWKSKQSRLQEALNRKFLISVKTLSQSNRDDYHSLCLARARRFNIRFTREVEARKAKQCVCFVCEHGNILLALSVMYSVQ